VRAPTHPQADLHAARAQEALAQVGQLELQLASGQATERRLSQELAAAREALSGSDAQVQELLDANTLLESQVRSRRWRAGHLRAPRGTRAATLVCAQCTRPAYPCVFACVCACVMCMWWGEGGSGCTRPR
jgi:hypothetical protein